MNPYREKYRRDLAELESTTFELMDRVSKAIDQSIKSLQFYDMDAAKAVVKGDEVVDELAVRIENKCMELLALQQPMAKDLRLIVSTWKICIDLERAGDLAVDIARVSIQSKDYIHVKRLEGFPRMADICQKMLKEVRVAIETRDANIARKVTMYDYEIDGLYVKVRDNLIRIVSENKDLINDTVPLLLVNRHLERIGDHICNICETIIYMIEGKKEHLN